MKKSALLLSILLIFTLPPVKAEALIFTPSFQVSSRAAVLINLDKNITVYEKNPLEKMYPASLTKIMTAMVVLDNIKDLDNTYCEMPLAVQDDLYGKGASNVGLVWGETTTATDLMYSMLLRSACESAGILACYVTDGSIPSFVDLMNKKAEYIGCVGTHFANPHGLYDDMQYTNTRDMALIIKYAVENYPKLVEIATTIEYSMKATTGGPVAHQVDGWITITHTNKMLLPNDTNYYPYSKGLKTGTLDESGRNLAALGSRDGHNYLLVTMGSPQYDADGKEINLHYADHKNIFDWAFDNFTYQKLISVTDEITEIPVKLGQDKDHVILVPAEDFYAIWPLSVDTSNMKKDIDTRLETDDDGEVTAPVEKGKRLGTYTLSFSGETIAVVDLVARDGVERSQMEYNIIKAKQFFNSGFFKLAVGIAIGLVVIYFIFFILVNRKKRSKLKRVNKSRRF